MKKVLFFILIAVLSGYSATKTWNSSGDTDFGTAGNWNPSGTPGATDDVVFDATSVVNCTGSASTYEVASFHIRVGYTGVYNDGGDSIHCHGEDSIGSGGNVTMTGAHHLSDDNAAFYLGSATTYTTTAFRLHFTGDNDTIVWLKTDNPIKKLYVATGKTLICPTKSSNILVNDAAQPAFAAGATINLVADYLRVRLTGASNARFGSDFGTAGNGIVYLQAYPTSAGVYDTIEGATYSHHATYWSIGFSQHANFVLGGAYTHTDKQLLIADYGNPFWKHCNVNLNGQDLTVGKLSIGAADTVVFDFSSSNVLITGQGHQISGIECTGAGGHLLNLNTSHIICQGGITTTANTVITPGTSKVVFKPNSGSASDSILSYGNVFYDIVDSMTGTAHVWLKDSLQCHDFISVGDLRTNDKNMRFSGNFSFGGAGNLYGTQTITLTGGTGHDSCIFTTTGNRSTTKTIAATDGLVFVSDASEGDTVARLILAAGKAHEIQAGKILTVTAYTAGDWDGTAGNLDTLRSTSDGSQAYLRIPAGVSASYVYLKDIFVLDNELDLGDGTSEDGGNDSNVTFSSAVTITYAHITLWDTVGEIGATFNAVLTGSPDSVGFIDALPAGKSLNHTDGNISGNATGPAQVATWYKMAAWKDGAPADTDSVSIAVTYHTAPTISYADSPWTLVRTVQDSNVVTAGNAIDSVRATGLPVGTTCDSSDGALGGTPTTVGTGTATITAYGPDSTTATPLPWTVGQYPTPPAGTYDSVSCTYGRTVAIDGNVYANDSLLDSVTWTGNTTGLAINASTGEITGTPTVAGAFYDTVTPWNAGGSGAITALEITVLPVPCTINDTAVVCSTAHAIAAVIHTTGGDTGTFELLDALPVALSHSFGSISGIVSSFVGDSVVRLRYYNDAAEDTAFDTIHCYLGMPVIAYTSPWSLTVGATTGRDSCRSTGGALDSVRVDAGGDTLPYWLGLDSSTWALYVKDSVPDSVNDTFQMVSDNASGSDTAIIVCQSKTSSGGVPISWPGAMVIGMGVGVAFYSGVRKLVTKIRR